MVMVSPSSMAIPASPSLVSMISGVFFSRPISMVRLSGMISGRMVRVKGQIGDNMIPGTSG